MRKVIVLVVAALVVAALPAQASARHTLRHRVTTLEAKVGALQRKVNALHAFTHDCLATDWAPIGWYGDFEGQNRFGYLYDNDGANPAQQPFYVSALDIAPNPEETAFYVAVVDAGCLGRIASEASSLRRQTRALEGSGRAFRALR